MELYPSLPALANAGNVAPMTPNSNLQWQQSNNEYIQQLYQSFGKLNDNSGDCIITPVNFALNDRCYAPDNNKGQLNTNAVDSLGYTYQYSFCQGGNALWREQIVARNVYAIELETLNKEQQFLSGVNTTNVKPFELSLEYMNDSNTGGLANETTTFQRDSEMKPFCMFDFVIGVNTAGVTVVGRS